MCDTDMGMSRSFGVFLALCIFLTAHQASATRDLLEESCVSLASDAASGPCQEFVQLQSQFPSDNPTDAEIQSFLDSHDPPSQSCCVEAGQLVTRRCQCDSTVQQFSALYDLTPSSLVTFARAAKLSCGPQYIASSVNPTCNSPSPSPQTAGR